MSLLSPEKFHVVKLPKFYETQNTYVCHCSRFRVGKQVIIQASYLEVEFSISLKHISNSELFRYKYKLNNAL